MIISQIVLETIDSLDMEYPKTDAQRRAELLSIRERLKKVGRNSSKAK